ncbi:hypothetical protein C8J56DRAFT_880351 [Mycena floridula]|nr:hypothetical protein C8J56DRAFT_880351 [Mycena floridula]
MCNFEAAGQNLREPWLLLYTMIDPPERKWRLGGFVIPTDVAADWAGRLQGGRSAAYQADPIKYAPAIYTTIDKEVKRHGRVAFYPVGEICLDKERTFMLVTRKAAFEGHKFMTPEIIPQFKEGEKEAKVRELLDQEGIQGYRFETLLD